MDTGLGRGSRRQRPGICGAEGRRCHENSERSSVQSDGKSGEADRRGPGEEKNMGITKGVEVFVRKVAPLGDPVEITVRGYELSVRKADAEMIQVE